MMLLPPRMYKLDVKVESGVNRLECDKRAINRILNVQCM